MRAGDKRAKACIGNLLFMLEIILQQINQLILACSKSAIEKPEKDVEYV